MGEITPASIRDTMRLARAAQVANKPAARIGKIAPFSFTVDKDDFTAKIDGKVLVRSLAVYCTKETELTVSVDTGKSKHSETITVSPKITLHENALHITPNSDIHLSLADKTAKCFITAVFAGE